MKKKLGLISLALVLALGVLGVGYALWSETLTIEGVADTGELDAMFRQAASNDDGQEFCGTINRYFANNGGWIKNIDPGDDGDDPEECQSMGVPTSRIGDDVAQTTVSGAWNQGTPYPDLPDPSPYKQLTVSIINGYPSYCPTIFFNIVMGGTIPGKVKAVKLVEVRVGGDKKAVNQELVACTTYYVDAETGTITTGATADSDFSIHLSKGTSLYAVMHTPLNSHDTAAGDLCIHVENGAKENTTYDFTIEIEVTQFNAP